MNRTKRFLMLLIIGVTACALVIGAMIGFARYRRASVLQRERNALKECDEIEFVNHKWPSECVIDDDGLNSEPLEVRRKAMLEMLDAATASGIAEESASMVYAKKQGNKTLCIMLGSGSFIVYSTLPPWGFRVEGANTLRIFQLPTHSETMEKAKDFLEKCDDIQFSTEKCRPGFLDSEGLNAEPLENRRETVRELFSECKPLEKTGEVSFTGVIFVKKDDKTVLKIALYESGFMMRGRYYEVLNPERNKTMLRLLNFKKLHESSQSP